MSIVLGINAFHAGASAALIVDGEVVYAIAEERLNRIKNYGAFPAMAIRVALDAGRIDFDAIDYVAIGGDSRSNLDKKFSYVAKNPLLIPKLFKRDKSQKRAKSIRELIIEQCGADESSLRYKQVNVEHHLAHTASAFYFSGWESAAGITIDGSGDFVTCMMSACEGRTIKPLHRVYIPHSLGLFYNMICQFIGYTKYGDEGKVMGLAPLGADTYRDEFRKMISLSNGDIKINPDYFIPFGSNQGIDIDDNGEMVVSRLYTDLMIERFGLPRERHAEITRRDMDLAFGLQHRFEEIYIGLYNHLHSIYPHDNVVAAGGCALNSVANGKLYDKTPFKHHFVQPASADEGQALGAAAYVSFSQLGEGASRMMAHSYLGGEYEDELIERELESYNIEYRRMDRENLIVETAQDLVSGKVVGWFQGRSEWGRGLWGTDPYLATQDILG